MGDVVYRAEIPITRVKGPLRLAQMPAEKDPVPFGTHGPIARHYGIQGEVPDPHATTIDYVMGAQGAGFKFENPNVKSTCGCGSSFQV